MAYDLPQSVDLESDSSHSKQLNIQTSPISPSFKGKTRFEGMNNDASDNGREHSPIDAPPPKCGVCLSAAGTAVRGCIDSCAHYFCFICIIEWSKIESRCPMCKRRFSTIRRMRGDGSFISTSAIIVPVRDQESMNSKILQSTLRM